MLTVFSRNTLHENTALQQKTVVFLYYPVVSENKKGYFCLSEAN